MKKNNLLIPFLFVLLNAAYANTSENPNTCINSPDETGCLLNIAKVKALKISDINKQAMDLAKQGNIGAIFKNWNKFKGSFGG